MATDNLTRKLAAIVVADIVGYSRLMEADESGTLTRLKALREELIDPKIAAHRGRIVKTTGDGMLVEFASVTDAVQSCVEIQDAMAGRNASVAEDRRLQFRVGINLGEIIIEGEDIYGTGVNVAARLESLAEPGGICISGTVHDQIQSIKNLGYEDMGEQKVKNMSKPVRSFAVLPGQGGEAAAPTPAPAGAGERREAPSIAVLPFQNMSGDAEQEYFADGIVEEIITALARFNWLSVIARNTTFTYKGSAVDVRQVAKELGVRYVLEGSVRKGGARVRITGQLIDAASGTHLWADRFEGDLADVFELQDQVTASVVGAIEPKMRIAEIERSRRKRPENLDAYDLFLRALPLVRAITPEANEEATELLEKAIVLDPNFAPALAYAAWCREQRVVRGWSTAQEGDVANGVELARAALAADSEDANTVAVAGFVLLMLGRDFEAGLAAVQRALDFNPNSAFVSMVGGWGHVFAGDLDTALACHERAHRLDPSDPFGSITLTGIGMVYLLEGRYDEALAWANKAIGVSGEWDSTYWVLAPALAYLGRADEAKEAIAKFMALSPLTASGLRETLPFRDKARLDIVIEGLRKAGLPD